MSKELESNKSYYAIVQKGQTFVGLSATNAWTVDWNTATKADAIKEWIAKHNPESASYSAIRRESLKRQVIIAEEAEAKRQARQAEREAIDQLRKEAYLKGSSLDFPSVISKPEYSDFYTYPEGKEPTPWNRSHDEEAYALASQEYRESVEQYEQAVNEHFDSLVHGSMLTVTDIMAWRYELIRRSFYGYVDGLLIFPQSIELHDEHMMVEAVALNFVDYSFVGIKYFEVDALLELVQTNEDFKIQSASTSGWHGADSRIRIELVTKTERKHEITLSLEWNAEHDYESRSTVLTAQAEIGTSGTYRTIADTKALVKAMQTAVNIGEQWEAQAPKTVSMS